MKKPKRESLLKAAQEADWQQVVYNGGSGPIHEYVSLEALLRSL